MVREAPPRRPSSQLPGPTEHVALVKLHSPVQAIRAAGRLSYQQQDVCDEQELEPVHG